MKKDKIIIQSNAGYPEGFLFQKFEGKPPANICTVCCGCGKETMSPHTPYDYPETALVETFCPDCNEGFSEEDYYDDLGNPIEPERHGESLVDAVMRLRNLVNVYEAQAKWDSYHKTRLLDALKAAYRKHHCGDDSIGWNELSDIMSNALPEVMGDDEFCAWMETI